MRKIFLIFGFLWTSSLGSAETVPKAKTMHFDMVMRKDSELGKSVIGQFEQAFKKLGYTFVADEFPTRRGIEELKNDRLDGTIGRIGNLVKLHGIKNLVRLDTAVMYSTLSLWCNKSPDVMATLKNPRVSYLHGSIYATRVMRRVENKNVVLSLVNGYSNMLTMMRNDRLDCLVASHAMLDLAGLDFEDLKGLHRHNLITARLFPWISKRHIHLKAAIEKELFPYTQDTVWRKRYLDERANCSENFETICPDGSIFSKQIDLKDDDNLMSSIGKE